MSVLGLPTMSCVGQSVGLIERHLAACERRGLRPTTLSTRRSVLMRLAARYGPLDQLDGDDLADWWDHHTSAPAARNVDLSHVRSFYRWLQRTGGRSDDPTVNLDRARTQRRLPRPISETDLEHAIRLADGRVAAWLTLAAFAGFRACEIAGLRGEDIDFDRQVLFVADGKGGHQRTVPMHPRVVDVLAGAPDAGPVWTNRSGRPITPNLVSVVACGHLRACGVDATLHQLRHRFGTRVYAVSHDLRVTQELLGHASPTTTAGYVAWSEAAGTAAVAAL